MQRSNAVVPESGERVFDYSKSNLRGLGWFSIVFGSVWTVVCLGMAAIPKTTATETNGLEWATWIVLPLFASIGIGIASSGVVYLRAHRREKFVLTPTEFGWIDRSGALRVRCPYSQVRRVEERILNQPSGGDDAPVHHRCVIQTDLGRVVFSDEIAEYNQLLAFFMSLDPTTPVGGEFTYRSKAIWLIPAVVLPLSGYFSVSYAAMYRHGALIQFSDGPQPTPLNIPVITISLSAVLWFFMLYGLMCNQCQRIVVADGRLRRYGPTGALKVDVGLDEVARGSFRKDKDPWKNGTYRYSVQTPQGEVKWSEYLPRCSDLVRILQRVSEQ